MDNRNQLPRRTLEELATLYRLEPETAEIYVEGSSDALLIKWFLEASGRRNWIVKTVDVLEVPSDLVTGYGQLVGQRGRVLAAGLHLGEIGTFPGNQPIFIADLDEDGLLEVRPFYGPLCLLTDYTSMELYAFDESTVSKFLHLFARNLKIDAGTLLAAMETPLRRLFFIRFALKEMNIGVGIATETEKCCKLVGDAIELNVFGVLQLTKQQSGVRSLDLDGIDERASELHCSSTGDPRLSIHGHDFVRLLAWTLLQLRVRRELTNHDVVAGALVSSMELQQLSGAPLFQELLKRALPR